MEQQPRDCGSASALPATRASQHRSYFPWIIHPGKASDSLLSWLCLSNKLTAETAGHKHSVNHFLQHLFTAVLLCVLKCKGIAFLFMHRFAGRAEGFYAASPSPIDHSGDTEFGVEGTCVSRRGSLGAFRPLPALQPQLYSRCSSAGRSGGGEGAGWEMAASSARCGCS